MSDVLTSWVAIFFDSLTWSLIGRATFVIVLVPIIIGFYKASMNPSNPVNIRDLWIDDTGKIGGSKMRLNGVWLMLLLVIAYQTLNGAVMEWLVAIVVAAFVTDRKFSRDSVTPEIKKEDEPK